MTTQEQIIAIYLQDEAKLYQDWYQTLYLEKDSTMRQIAKPPSLPELRVICQNWAQRWVERNRLLLRNSVVNAYSISSSEPTCKIWKRIRRHRYFHEWKDFIAAFTVVLASTNTFHPNHLQVVATVFVTIGVLDWICEDQDPPDHPTAWAW